MPRTGYKQTPEHRSKIAAVAAKPRPYRNGRVPFHCSVPDCDAVKHKGLGYCGLHYELAQRLRRMDISVDEYYEQLEHQGGGCAICGTEITPPQGMIDDRSKVAHADHDRVSGAFRGLLCCGCNHGLGKFKDSVFRLESAIFYLQQSA